MWEILIIPIIGLAVWIISTLLRGEDDVKNPGAPRVQRKGEKVTDLDRFLREVQQRRQGKERAPEPTAQTEYRREEPSAPPPPPREEPVQVVVVEAPVVVATLPPLPAPVARPAPPPPPVLIAVAQSIAPPLVVEVVPSRAEAPALPGLRELLGSRNGLRRAMILSEVLGPPVSRRR